MKRNKIHRKTTGFSTWKVLLILLVTGTVVALGALRFSSGSARPATERTTYKVNRGDLVIDVLEAGNVEAANSLDVKSQVEGRSTLISLVDEGTVITEKDIQEKKVLVQLDSSAFREAQDQQEIAVEGAKADFTDAKESYEIQVKQNESDVKAGELKLKFARMDMEKYLGADLSGRLIQGATQDIRTALDIIEATCEALQTKQKLESDIDLAREKIARASDTLEWTRKLEAEGYVTANDLKADELALKTQQVSLEQAIVALELFKEFEFPKEIETLLSGHEEAERELDRIKAKARSELAKAESQRTSKGLALKKEEEKLTKLAEQIGYCTVVATQPGLVVYAGGHDWDERIVEGMEVRERQNLITIPNTTSMVVRTQVHESMVTRVHEGLKVDITVDALPGRPLEGKVDRVWVLPDTQNRWLNPNLKVYRTDISIIGNDHLDLKPGMSAQVRIIIDELKDVLSVPLQAVTTRGDEQFVFVMTPSGPKRQVVRTGDYNDKFIHVTEGLAEGETVILDVADLVDTYKRPQLEKGKAPEQFEQPVAAEKGRGRDAGRRSS